MGSYEGHQEKDLSAVRVLYVNHSSSWGTHPLGGTQLLRRPTRGLSGYKVPSCFDVGKLQVQAYSPLQGQAVRTQISEPRAFLREFIEPLQLPFSDIPVMWHDLYGEHVPQLLAGSLDIS